ncbi:NYN domain-containing protein [Galbitalea sp. SE-J8]|uniref:NYN domain-containing protein n=1 Tax=Galbitalea sp. SE-J8 TaxID=3054952 RepID=UPI00259CB04A|nr:NYN domain-containing protein [Galbitalea sp. SE-J8]MDM4763852.1 NYN domain-containing protein [Galbitalea sp. SE-J8]
MPDATDARVAVYIDFDNIVISRFDQVHGRGQFISRRVRSTTDDDVRRMSLEAQVDIGAILDYASSFGTVVISKAYADWSAAINASYRSQLIDRAVDLVQLFTTTAGMKNGADIRLAIDVVDDLFRLGDITHVVIVAGDSDYIALAQRSRRLGRYVVGIGVAGSTSRFLASACDEFASYDELPGVAPAPAPAPPEPDPEQPEDELVRPADPQDRATELLVRAMRVGHAREDTDDWLHASSVKNQMVRMDGSFSQKALGFRSFTDFVKSREGLIDMREDGTERMLRLRDR